MKRFLLLILFAGLMADSMFGWGLGVAPGVSLKNLLLYMLVLIIAIEAAIKGWSIQIELPSIHLLFGLLILIALLSWVANSFIASYVDYDPLQSFIAFKGGLVDHYLFFLVFFLAVRTEQDVASLQRIFLMLLVAANIVTLMDAFSIPDFGFIETRNDGRVEGPLGEANQYGLFIAMMIPLLLAQAPREEGFVRAYLYVGAAASFFTMLMTVSRGALVSLIFGSIIAALFLKEHMNPKYMRRLVAMALVGAAFAALIIGQEYKDLIIERTQDAVSSGSAEAMTSGRTWIWSTALDFMMRRPLSLISGYGWNTFHDVMFVAPHNVYLHRFFELGIIGLAAFLGIFAAILFRCRRAVNIGTNKGPLHALLIGFVFGFCILLTGIFAVDLANPWYFVWSFVGLSMRATVVVFEQAANRTAPSPAASTGTTRQFDTDTVT